MKNQIQTAGKARASRALNRFNLNDFIFHLFKWIFLLLFCSFFAISHFPRTDKMKVLSR